MTRSLRPRLESLEGRTMLSAAAARPAPLAESLGFVAPGSTTRGVHALVSQQAGAVALTLQLSPPGGPKFRRPIEVDVATGPIPTGPATVPWNWRDPRPIAPVAPAQPGVHYQSVHQTVTFAPGVTSQTITIPIVAGAANPGLVGFEVTATQLGTQLPGDGRGQATEDVYLTQEIAAPVPRIDGARLIAIGGRTAEFVLHFNRPMDPASVQDILAYEVQDTTFHSSSFNPFGSWGVSSLSASTVLKSATYNAAANEVHLRLAKPVDARDGFRISRGYSVDHILRDTAGTPIHADGSGAGSGFEITLSSTKATIFDGVNLTVLPTTPSRRPRRA